MSLRCARIKIIEHEMEREIEEGIKKEIQKIGRQMEEGKIITASENVKILALRLDKEGLGKSLKKLEEAV